MIMVYHPCLSFIKGIDEVVVANVSVYGLAGDATV